MLVWSLLPHAFQLSCWLSLFELLHIFNWKLKDRLILVLDHFNLHTLRITESYVVSNSQVRSVWGAQVNISYFPQRSRCQLVGDCHKIHLLKAIYYFLKKMHMKYVCMWLLSSCKFLFGDFYQGFILVFIVYLEALRRPMKCIFF